MEYLGIDGCSGGWVIVAADSAGNCDGAFVSDIEQTPDRFKDARLALIDIPIGLPDRRLRACDMQAKKMLGRKHASVFMTPCREAVYARSYEEACQICQYYTGKKISRQVWNILPKIREVDRFLRNHPAFNNYYVESHPELCFLAFNGRRPLEFNKRREEGCRERLTILRRTFSTVDAVFKKLSVSFADAPAGRDDVLDALVLAVTASRFSLKRLPDQPVFDRYGLPVHIHYPIIGSFSK